MKMAKATQADLDMANELAGILEALVNRSLPVEIAEAMGTDSFDIDDREHCREAMGLIMNTLRKASLFRVTFGMQVLLDPGNAIVDPDARTLEVHPKFECAARERDRFRTALDAIAHSNRTKTGLKELAKAALFPAEEAAC